MATVSTRQPDGELPESEPPDPTAAPAERLYCDGCEQSVPGTDCRRWDRYVLCLRCQEEYITAWAMGRRVSPGQYVRDKRFGEEEAYTLSS
jgi:hypothetical protein